MLTNADLNCRIQALSRIDISGEQATKAIVYGLFQVLLASEVAFCRQDGGVTEKKLYLLQFTTVHMAELCAGSPKVVWCEVVELQTKCTTPDYVPDDVFGYAVTPDSSVTTDCPEDSSRRGGCSCQPSVYGILHPAGHRNGADVVALADQVNDRPMALSDLYVFSAKGGQLCSAQTAAEQDRDHGDIPNVA
jgi:hypothetical protein